MKKIFFAFLLVIAGFIIYGANSEYEYLLTAISRTYLQGHSTANIDDYTAFETRVVETSTPQEWELDSMNGQIELSDEFKTQLQENNAIAFLTIRNGKILTEDYFDDYSNESMTNSFSMAKTVTTMLVGCAIEDGLIEGMDQKIVDFYPEFADDEFGKNATIASLCKMTSGYKWSEAYYSPTSPTVRLLYGDDVESFLVERGFDKEPESEFYYSSASSMLLGTLLKRALQKQDSTATLSSYLSEKLWQPMGMNADALWHLDGQGLELSYCCLNTNARNYAKLGQLYLQNGKWNGIQLVDSAFIDLMRTPAATSYFGYSTWINNESSPQFYGFRGHLGQLITIVPEHDLILVRLGHDRGKWGDDSDGMIIDHINHILPLIKNK